MSATIAGRAARAPYVAAVMSVVAGLAHYAVVPEHRAEWVWYAVFFTVLGAFQVIWAALAWTGDRRVLLTGALVNLAVIGLWAVSRTSGLPVGPDAGEPEAVGALDVVCVAAEAIIAACALVGMRARGWLAEPGTARTETDRTGSDRTAAATLGEPATAD
ncbi:MAG TPA: hypothetical protein VF054_16750 [Micromonosporaceae bacterium]